MTTLVRCVGEPRDADRWRALDWAARELAPALDGDDTGVDVSVRPTLVCPPDADEKAIETELTAMRAGGGGPFRVAGTREVTYAATPQDAAGHARSLATASGRDAVIQTVTAPLRNGRRYPTLAGELLTENPYPISYLDPRDGIARVVLGLGDDLAVRTDALRFCPRHPDVMPDFSQPDDILRNGQKTFVALAGEPSALEPREHPLDAAREDRTLDAVGGVVSIESQTVYPGVHREGARTVTCAMLLRGHPFGFAPLLVRAVEHLAGAPTAGRDPDATAGGDRSPLRLRFALELPAARETTRPALYLEDLEPLPRLVPPEPPGAERTLLATRTAMGLGAFADTRDLLYVPPERFDVARSPVIAREIAALDASLATEMRRYVLVVPGRLGSTDRALGVPVRWRDVSGASVHVEVALEGFNVEESHGTHFFRQLTNEGVGYLHVSLAQPGAAIHWDRLAAMPASHEGTFVRHVRSEPPLSIWIDGVNGRGVIGAPG